MWYKRYLEKCLLSPGALETFLILLHKMIKKKKKDFFLLGLYPDKNITETLVDIISPWLQNDNNTHRKNGVHWLWGVVLLCLIVRVRTRKWQWTPGMIDFSIGSWLTLSEWIMEKKWQLDGSQDNQEIPKITPVFWSRRLFSISDLTLHMSSFKVKGRVIKSKEQL